MRIPLLIVALVGLLLLTGSATLAARPGPATERSAKIQQKLDALVATGVPGAIALVRTGDQTIRLAAGNRNRTAKTPIRADDRFRIGSVTKTFLATVVLQLAGEGKLSLDDDVGRWLPGVVPNGRHITVLRLLNMTSGLYDYADDPRIVKPLLAGNFGYFWPPRRLIAIAASHKPHFAPGKGWSYCNTCYILLGLIVEKASGHPLEAELKRRIFAPLHLRSTSFDTQQRIAGPHSQGYYRQDKQLVDTTLISPSSAWAAGAIVSTVDDVATFFRALYGGRLLRPELLREMRTTVFAYSSTARYGLGLATAPTPCGAIWGNHGDIVGFGTDAWGSKDGERFLVLFVNLDEVSLSKRSQQAKQDVLMAAHCG